MTPGRSERALTLLRGTGLAVALATGAGFACLGAVLAPRSILGAALVGALAALAGFAVVVGRAEPALDGLQLRGNAFRAAGASGGTVALVVLALAGMATVLGAATAPVLLFCVLATAPWLWTRLSPYLPGGRTRRLPDRALPVRAVAGPTPSAPPAEPAPETLSTPALCGRWQRSYFALADPAQHDRIVALRRRYLEELERRDPDGVARWLATDARPAGTSPARHLSAGAAPHTIGRPTPTTGTDPSLE